MVISCAPQLCGVLSQVFNLSLHLQRVPVLWKTSCLVPVPKTPRPSGPQDYRLMALTSYIMKTLERLVLEQLRPIVRSFTVPLQFAYQPRLGVEDGIIYLLNRVYTHLDKPANTVTTVRTPTELCVGQGGQQHWGPTGDCPIKGAHSGSEEGENNSSPCFHPRDPCGHC